MNTSGDRSAENNSDLNSLFSPIHFSSMREEGPSLRKINDTRLAQALKYLKDEGGDDSPDRYMKRVNRIFQDLVRQLAWDSDDFDETLHKHLEVAVQEQFRAYTAAIYGRCPTVLEADVSALESEHSRDGHPISAAPALYRSDDGLQSPVTSHSGSSATGEMDYENLTLRKIRRRLKIPTLPERIEDEIKRWCTVEQIDEVVKEYQSLWEGDKPNKDELCQAKMSKLMLELHGHLTDIRHGVNASPTKLRGSSAQNSSQSPKKKARPADDQISLGRLPPNATAPSPVARKIDRSRAISLKDSPRRQSGISTAPPSAEIAPTESASLHQGSGDNGESNTLANPSSSKKARRKRSIGERAYTPEKKRKRSATPSSQKKSGGASLQTPGRSLRFMSIESDDLSSDESIAIRGSKPRKVVTKHTPKSVVKATPKPKTTFADDETKASSSKRSGAARKSPFVKDTTAESATKSGKMPSNTSLKVTNKVSKAIAAGRAVYDEFTEKKAVKKGSAEKAPGTRSTKSGAKQRK